MGKLTAALRLFRPANGIMAILAVLTGATLAVDGPTSQDMVAVALLSISSFLTVSAMNCINDLRDTKTDRKAHPERPLVTGLISQGEVKALIGGLLISAFTLVLIPSIGHFRWAPLAIFSFALCMNLMYETRCKYLGLRGNVNIGILTGTLFIFGASLFSISPLILLIGGMAAAVNVGREIVKDVQDREGDLGSRITLVMMKGERFALIVSHIFIVLGVVLSLFLPLIESIPRISLFFILGADLIFLVSIFISRSSPRRAQVLLKMGMALSLMGFVLLGIIDG